MASRRRRNRNLGSTKAIHRLRAGTTIGLMRRAAKSLRTSLAEGNCPYALEDLTWAAKLTGEFRSDTKGYTMRARQRIRADALFAKMQRRFKQVCLKGSR